MCQGAIGYGVCTTCLNVCDFVHWGNGLLLCSGWVAGCEEASVIVVVEVHMRVPLNWLTKVWWRYGVSMLKRDFTSVGGMKC